jgi:hypothetical protein
MNRIHHRRNEYDSDNAQDRFPQPVRRLYLELSMMGEDIDPSLASDQDEATEQPADDGDWLKPLTIRFPPFRQRIEMSMLQLDQQKIGFLPKKLLSRQLS